MRISENGINFIKNYESFKAKPYVCPAGVLTIGYGSTENVKIGDTITNEEATNRLKKHIETIEDYLNKLKLNQNQFDALCSFAYNCGLKALKDSTLIDFVKVYPNGFVSIHKQFLIWNKVKGKIVKGLTIRREAEYQLYIKK